MNTNQDTTLTNQDAFEKWLNTERGASKTITEGMHRAYSAGHKSATKASEQRIQDLEAEVANLHTVMMAAAVEITERWEAHCDEDGCGPANLVHRLENGYPEQYGYDAKTMVRMDKQIDELTESNNQLREALRLSTNGLRTVSRWSISEETEKAITTQIIANENALSSTPTQSLAQHDNEVLCKIVSKLEDMNANGKYILPDYIETIRAMKATP